MNQAMRQISSPIYLFAAYGCRYSTVEAAICAWESGKDFSINGWFGPYCSIRDFEDLKKEMPSGIYLCYGMIHEQMHQIY